MRKKEENQMRMPMELGLWLSMFCNLFSTRNNMQPFSIFDNIGNTHVHEKQLLASILMDKQIDLFLFFI